MEQNYVIVTDSSCDSDICLFRFSRTIYDASHNRDFNIERNICHHCFHFIRKTYQINLCSSAGRTRYDFDTAFSKP